MRKTGEKNIYTVMTTLNKAIMIDGSFGDIVFDEDTKMFFSYLDLFFKDCPLYTDKYIREIIRNYDTSPTTLANYFIDVDGNDTFNANKVRIARTRTNKVFVEFLGNPLDIESGFLRQDKEFMAQLCEKVKVLKIGLVAINNTYIQGYLDNLIKNQLKKEFSIDECKNEIKFLMTLSNQNIDKLGKTINKEKLSYVLSLFRSKLVNNETVNKDKIDLLLMITREFENKSELETYIDIRDCVRRDVKASEEESEESYRIKYEKLLKKYNELVETIDNKQDVKAVDEQVEENSIVTIFDSVMIPSALIELLYDMAEEYDGVKELDLDVDAEQLKKTLACLAKFSLAYMNSFLEQLDTKSLYLIWCAINNKLVIPSLDNNSKQYKDVLTSIGNVLADRIDLVCNDDLIAKDISLLQSNLDVDRKSE